MAHGTAMGNQRSRQQFPRQVEDRRNRIPNSRYVVYAPPEYFEPAGPEPLAGPPRREEGTGGLTFVLLLVLVALVVVIYWTAQQSTSSTPQSSPLGTDIRRTDGMDIRQPDATGIRRADGLDLHRTDELDLRRSVGTDIRQVDVYELNMRERPSMTSPVKFILPRGTRVEILNEAQQEFDGDVWIKVRVQTREGLQDGWVDARYIR